MILCLMLFLSGTNYGAVMRRSDKCRSHAVDAVHKSFDQSRETQVI